MTAVNQNIELGNENAELLASTVVGFISGSGGNDTIQGAINGLAPGSTLSGDNGNDSIASQGIGDIALGGAGDDTIRNDSGQATLSGGDGNDVIEADDKQTTVFGGAGNDSINLKDDSNIVFAGNGNDTIVAADSADILAGGAGNDHITAAPSGNAFSLLFGNAGNDTIKLGNTTADSAYGGAGNDSVYAGSSATADGQYLGGEKGADIIFYLGAGKGVILDGDRGVGGEVAGTDAGADSFTVGSSATEIIVLGGAANDSLSGTLGINAQVFMGQGSDYFNVVSSGSSTISGDLGADSGSILLGGNDSVYGDGPSQGSDATLGADSLNFSGASNNVIFADTGDTSSTLGGDDVINITSGTGNRVYGGGGNDSLVSAGGNTLIGGAGNDIYIVGAGDVIPFDSLGVNTYVAGSGASTSDTITVGAGDSFVGGATFFVTGETELIKTITNGGVIASNEQDLIMIGTADGFTSLAGGDDTLAATNLVASGSVFGGDGNDVFTISGTSAAGLVDGGAGNDTLSVAGIFTGSASGGDGNDVFDIDTIGAGASIDAGAGDERIVIPAVGTETSAAATVVGGAGNDTIAIAYQNVTEGSTGLLPLVIDGGAGDDILYGQVSGGDSISGGAGNDTLYGGGFGQGEADAAGFGSSIASRRDTLFGGAGADVFIYGCSSSQSFDDGLDLATGGSAVFGQANFISDGSSAAATTRSTYNGVDHVDIIADFNPAEDILLLNSEASSVYEPGMSATAIAGGDPFEAGSLTYLANNTSPIGVFFGDTGVTGTGNTFGIIADNSTGFVDLEDDGTQQGEFSTDGFTYDTDTGALYDNLDRLIMIFAGAPALRDENIRAVPIVSETPGIPLI